MLLLLPLLILKKGTFCSALERVSTLSLIWHGFATLTHLVLITVDRYIAIKKPLRYRDIVTTRRVTVAVISVWTFAIFVIISEVILSAVNSGADMYNIYLTIWDLSAHHCYLDFHNFHHKNVLVHFLGNPTTTRISD